MKYVARIIGTLIVMIAVIIAGIGSYNSHDYHLQMKPVEPQICEMIILQEIEIELPPIPEIHYSSFEPEVLFLNLTFEEQDLLERIAMAEAKGEGVKGMALVMCVVLNRSREWNMSIHDVIYATGQFYTAGMCEGSDACHEALALVMDGWDESDGALYFNKYGFRSGREPLFQYGEHYFSK